MSETLKFGNGIWATKKGSTLAYNSENGNFKPLPFTFDRSTSATRVNKEGLIEVVSNNEPRIDFLNDSKGALLLEPSRSNLLTYSEDFSDAFWSKSGASVVGGKVSPSGDTSAFKLVESATTAIHKVFENVALGITTGTVVTASVYAKAGERSILKLQPYIGTKYIYVNFDLSNGTIGLTSGDEISKKIELLSNGYYRCSITFLTDGTSVQTHFVLTDSNIAGVNPSYTGDGTSGIYIFGAQLEQGYATSYIPTQGSVVTRVAESCSQTPPSGIIGQTEGTMFVETSKWVESNNGRFFSISDGTTSNYIIIIQNNTFSNYAVYILNGGITQLAYSATNALPNNSKIAISYKLNDCVVSVNGEIVHTNTSVTLPSTSKIYIGSRENGAITYYSSNPIKDARLYNTTLTDAELIALTS